MKKDLVNVMFDIECVRGKLELGDFYDDFDKAWRELSWRKYEGEIENNTFQEKAGLVPEFGMIVCIVAMDSVSKIPVRFKMVLDDDVNRVNLLEAEKVLLANFYKWLEDLQKENKKGIRLIGHNIRKFDIPYVNVRTVKHGIKIHSAFKMYDVKPWDSELVDTMEVWKGGMYATTQASGLSNVCRILGVESPKGKGEEELEGSMVGDYFWDVTNEKDFNGRINEICNYCERDVKANAEALNRMYQLGMI